MKKQAIMAERWVKRSPEWDKLQRRVVSAGVSLSYYYKQSKLHLTVMLSMPQQALVMTV